MKYYSPFLFLIVVFLIGCEYRTNDNNEIDTKLEITQLQRINDVLWDRIQKNPDSVYIDLNGINLLLTGDSSQHTFSPRTLRGLTSSKHQLVLEDLGGAWGMDAYVYFLFYEDVNFDGKKDLGLLNNYGATGNYWYSIWIFNQNENKFIYDDYYSGMPSPIFDTLNKIVQVYYRMGACDETIVFIEKDKATKRVYTEKENTKTGSNCWCITETLTDSIWKETERKIIYKSLDRLYRNQIPVVCGGFELKK